MLQKVKLKEFVLLRWQLRGCVVVLQPVGLLGSGGSHEDGNATEAADRLRCGWVCWGVVLGSWQRMCCAAELAAEGAGQQIGQPKGLRCRRGS